MNQQSNIKRKNLLHHDSLHESGFLHAKGEAQYVDDLPLPPHSLWAFPVLSSHACARIKNIDYSAALELDGVSEELVHFDLHAFRSELPLDRGDI